MSRYKYALTSNMADVRLAHSQKPTHFLIGPGCPMSLVHLGTHCNRTVAEVHVYTAEPPLMDTPNNRQPLYNRCPKHLHVCWSQLQISVCVYVIKTTTFLSVAITTPH